MQQQSIIGRVQVAETSAKAATVNRCFRQAVKRGDVGEVRKHLRMGPCPPISTPMCGEIVVVAAEEVAAVNTAI